MWNRDQWMGDERLRCREARHQNHKQETRVKFLNQILLHLPLQREAMFFPWEKSEYWGQELISHPEHVYWEGVEARWAWYIIAE